MIELFGFSYPDLFLTLAKLSGTVCVIFFIADQYFEDE